jgi:hypothetical protein
MYNISREISPLTETGLDTFYINKIMKTILIGLSYTILFLASFSFELYSQESGGGYAETYLLRTVGTRAQSMSGAYTAISNEPSSIFNNPAGIGFLPNKPTISSSISSYGLGRSQASLLWGQRLNRDFGIGFGILSYNSDKFMGRDGFGNETGTLQDWQYAMALSAAYRKESMSLGITAKYLKHRLSGSDTYATGAAIDIGTKFDIFEVFTIGLTMKNIGSQMFWNKYDSRQALNESLPYSIHFGIATEFGIDDEYKINRSSETGKLVSTYIPPTKYILVGLDAVLFQYDENPTILLGLEAVVHDMLSVRAGFDIYGNNITNTGIDSYEFFPMNRWATGLTLKPEIENISFDLNIEYTVAAELISNSGVSHNFGLVFAF